MSIKVTSGQIIKDVKLLEVDNIRVDNNTISSTNVDGDIILDPNGTGNVNVSSNLVLSPSSGQIIGGETTTLIEYDNGVVRIGDKLICPDVNGDTRLEDGDFYIDSGNLKLSSNSQIFVGDSVLSLEDTINDNITSSYTIGALNAGNTLTSGSNLTTILKLLLQNVFFPSFSNPSGSLGARTTFTPTTVGASTSKVEVGTNTAVSLSASFSRGSINGRTIAPGVWQTGGGNDQNSRSGVAHSYVINGVNNATTTRTTSNVTIQSTNSWSGTIHYLEGPQPIDSSGANYLSPLSAGFVSISTGTSKGTGVTSTGSIIGVRPFFYGVSNGSTTPPTTSSAVRSLTSNISWDAPAVNQTLALIVPSGTTMVVFAYPASLRNLTSVLTSGSGLPLDITGVFGQYSAPDVQTTTDPYTVSVLGAAGFTATDYKVFVYIPAAAIEIESTYNFTI